MSDYVPVPFSVVARAEGKKWIISVAGDVDTCTAPVLSDAVASLAAIEAHPCVAVDMRDVSFMDSAGLGALIRGFKACEANGGTFSVCCASHSVRRILEMTGQLQRFAPAMAYAPTP